MASEFEIIKKLRAVFPKIGDDAVEFKVSNIPIVSTDAFVMGEHFGDYFTPYDMGYKALSASISDIAACGGIPKYVLVSMGLSSGEMDFINELYRGMQEVANLYKVEIIGGDTTKSSTLFISVTVIGETKRFIGRNGARVGDAICVTGELGSSAAGLLALKNGLVGNRYICSLHLNPKPRVKEGIKIGKYASSMIDISDGLIIDLSHLLEESCVGAEIWKNKIPISKETIKIANKFSLSAQDFAMSGGEDFELLFTIPKDKLKEAQKKVDFTEIGEIIEPRTENRKPRIIDEEGNDIPVAGFDHFNRSPLLSKE
ncbi:MAG: thiamine-phosphate kinase [Candidatus Stahlbacteria bacterium]|nr:thiamine-phosphate kinase [Candidatus Stahlbacteria bacterium]